MGDGQKYDEFGIPIKTGTAPVIEESIDTVDEFGIPIKKKSLVSPSPSKTLSTSFVEPMPESGLGTPFQQPSLPPTATSKLLESEAPSTPSPDSFIVSAKEKHKAGDSIGAVKDLDAGLTIGADPSTVAKLWQQKADVFEELKQPPSLADIYIDKINGTINPHEETDQEFFNQKYQEAIDNTKKYETIAKKEPYAYSFIAPKPVEASTTAVAPVLISPKGTEDKGVSKNRPPTEFTTEPKIGEIAPVEASTTGLGQRFISNAITPITVEDARKEGKKPTYENYIETKRKQELVKQQPDYVEKNITGVYGGLREATTAVEDFSGINPNAPLLPQSEDRKGVMVNNPDYKSITEKKVGNVLDAVNGTLTAVFDAAMLTPQGVAFTAGVKLAPKPITDFLLAPADDIASKIGYVPKEGSLGRKFLTLGNIAGSIALLHGATSLGGKLMKGKELTPEEIPQVKEIFEKATPTDLMTAFDSPDFQKYFHQFNFHENGVVNIIEKMREGKDIVGDIAKLDAPKETIDMVLETAQQGDILTDKQAIELGQKFEEVKAAKESVPEEHKINPEIISLITEKNKLLEKKKTVDSAFHPEIDEQIKGKDLEDGTHIDGIDDKIRKLTKPISKFSEAIGETKVESKPTVEPVSPSVAASETSPLSETELVAIKDLEKGNRIFVMDEATESPIELKTPDDIKNGIVNFGDLHTLTEEEVKQQFGDKKIPLISELPKESVATTEIIEPKVEEGVVSPMETNVAPEVKLNPESKILSEAHPKENIDFANEMIDSGLFYSVGEILNYRPDLGLSTKEVKQGIKDVKADKNTAPARKIIEATKDIKDKGEINMIIGRGGIMDRKSIPLEEYRKMVKEDPMPTELMEEHISSEGKFKSSEAIDIINKEGITKENFVSLEKDLKDWYSPEEIQKVKTYLNETAESKTRSTPETGATKVEGEPLGEVEKTKEPTKISERVPQREHRKKIESNSRNEEISNELRRRIEKAHKEVGISSIEGKDLRDIDNKVAYDFAKETNTWIDNFDSLGERFRGGNENTIVSNEGKQKLYKSNNLSSSFSLSKFFDKIRLHNELFPDTPYTFEGFTGIKDMGKGRPYVEPVYSQDFIKNTKDATPAEISDYMKNLGFEQVNESSFKKGDIDIWDLKPRNVLKDKDGNIYIIDAELKQKKVDKPLTELEQANKDFDEARAAFRKKMGFGAGVPLQAIPEFIAVVKAALRAGYLTAKDFIEKYKDDFPDYKEEDIVSSFDSVHETIKKAETPLEEGKKMRGFAESVKEATPGMTAEINANPELQYEPQKLKDVKKNLSDMTDEQKLESMNDLGKFASIESGNNFGVLAGIDLMNKYIAEGKDPTPILEKLSKAGTAMGQLIRQFAELKGSTPESVLMIFEKELSKKDRTLTEGQKEIIKELSKSDIEARAKYNEQKKNTESEYTEDNMKELRRLKDEAEKKYKTLAKYMMDITPKDFWETSGIMLQGNLLTPMSIITNPFSNALLMPLRFAEKALVTPIDALYSFITGKPRSVTMEGTVSGLKGFGMGVAEAGKQIWTGLDVSDLKKAEVQRGFRPLRSLMQAWTGKDMPLNAKGKISIGDRAMKVYEGLLGAPPEIMFRLLSLGDKPFLRMAEQSSLYRIAKSKGLKGKEFEKFMRFPDKKSYEEMQKTGQEATFQEESKIASLFSSGISQLGKIPYVGGVFKFLAKTQMPYIKTPTNIISQTLDYAVPPISLAKALYHASKGNRRESLINLGKFGVGSMMIYGADYLYQNNIISPSPDERGKEKQKALRYQVFPPNSVNISALGRLQKGESTEPREGDEFISYSKMGIMGAMLNMRANLGEKGWQEGKDGRNKDAMGYVHSMVASFPDLASFSLEQSFLQGTTNLLEAIKDKEWDNWIAGTFNAVSSIPLPNSVAALNRVDREYIPALIGDNLGDRLNNVIKNKTFQSDGFPLKINLWGEKIKQTPEGSNAWIYQLFDVTKMQEIKDNKLSKTIYDLWRKTQDSDVIPTIPERTITIGDNSVRLTQSQYQELLEEVGKERKTDVDKLIEKDFFKSFDDEQKIKSLKRHYEKEKDSAFYRFKKELILTNEQEETLGDNLRIFKRKLKSQH